MKRMTIKIARMAPTNQEAVDYCRSGYGEHVISHNARDEVGDAIMPAGFVATDPDGHFVGRAVVGFEHDQAFHVPVAGGAEAPWIYAVFVEESYRGQGIGNALIQSCLHYLATECKAAFVCLDSNTAGQWYVEKFGFMKSHSGSYEGDVFDIYYRKLAGDITSSPDTVVVLADSVEEIRADDEARKNQARAVAANATPGGWIDSLSFIVKS